MGLYDWMGQSSLAFIAEGDNLLRDEESYLIVVKHRHAKYLGSTLFEFECVTFENNDFFSTKYFVPPVGHNMHNMPNNIISYGRAYLP